MTLFEYLAIAFSLIFSASAMRLIGGLPHATQPGRRYSVHLAYVCFQLAATAAVFWVFWSFRDLEWTFGTFLLVLVSPAIVYYNACTIVPEMPGEVGSWRDYFFAVRRRYFLGFVAWVVAVATISSIVMNVPVFHPVRLMQASLLVASLVGLWSADERVHKGLVLFFLGYLGYVAVGYGMGSSFFSGPR